MYAALVNYSVLKSAVKRVQLVRECWITVDNGPCLVRDLLLALTHSSGVLGSELVFKFVLYLNLSFLTASFMDVIQRNCICLRANLTPADIGRHDVSVLL